tara:strand:- start:258 stop:818 length:561 start_codon:yes stop_codon:yes gene_type:complete
MTQESLKLALEVNESMSINRKRGSIALARSLCYQINGAADDSDDISAGGGYGSVDIAEILSGEVVRLQEALAQRTEQEYESVLIDGVAYTIPSKVAVEILGLHLDLLQLKQEQEPVAWMLDGEFYKTQQFYLQGGHYANQIPLYTALPQRTWVGLTDEERSELVTLHHGWNEYGQAIESKLKELNT